MWNSHCIYVSKYIHEYTCLDWSPPCVWMNMRTLQSFQPLRSEPQGSPCISYWWLWGWLWWGWSSWHYERQNTSSSDYTDDDWVVYQGCRNFLILPSRMGEHGVNLENMVNMENVEKVENINQMTQKSPEDFWRRKASLLLLMFK